MNSKKKRLLNALSTVGKFALSIGVGTAVGIGANMVLDILDASFAVRMLAILPVALLAGLIMRIILAIMNSIKKAIANRRNSKLVAA